MNIMMLVMGTIGMISGLCLKDDSLFIVGHIWVVGSIIVAQIWG